MRNMDGQKIESCPMSAQGIGNCASCAFHRNWTNSSRLREGDGERCDNPDAVPGSPK